jgi:DUF2971 family protein
MPSVFHYTDANGLNGILVNESLYATDYRYLNDAMEAGSLRSYIMPVFEEEIGTISKKLIEKKFLKPDYYKELGSQADILQAEKLYSAFSRAVDNVSPFFVLSFCRHASGSYEFQHGLLSQWRGYADGGGFAIEFDENELDSMAKSEKENFAYAGFKSENVEYDQHEKLFNAADYTGVAGEMIWQVFAEAGKDVSSVTGRADLDATVLKFVQTAPFLKHHGFCEESEYRMVFICIRAKKIPEEETRPAKYIQFRHKGGLLIPYIELFDTVRKPRLPVRGVIVGPHPLQERQAESAKMLLEAEGFDAPVRLSEIPYRK